MKQYLDLLESAYTGAEDAYLRKSTPAVVYGTAEALDTVFESKTQAYREVLLGCVLTRMVDRAKDIRLPYARLGSTAFSGRSLDEQVINPFLRDKSIPCSKGPYLSVFRRNVSFTTETMSGLKDKKGYGALLSLIETVHEETDDTILADILTTLIYRFILLREESQIDPIRLDRIRLSQFRGILSALIQKRSGGRFPVLFALSMVEAIAQRFSLQWAIECQGINVADSVSRAGGDITIKEEGIPVMTIEVTERPLSAPQVRSTFRTKVVPNKVEDYVFLVHIDRISDETKTRAHRFSAQGYEINLVDIYDWLVGSLVTIGLDGRQRFQDNLIRHLSDPTVPKALRLMWNEEIERLVS
jgi:hypothetical protein